MQKKNDISVALLVIDMQEGYFQGEPLASARKRIVRACNELINAAKAYDRPIFMIRTEHATDRSTWTLNMLEDGEEFLVSGSDEVALLPELTRAGEEIIKTRDSAFYQTDLAGQLHERGITQLVLSGVSTHSCVAQTAMAAYAENFEVVLAGEAIATHDEAYHSVIFNMLEQEYRQKTLENNEAIALLKKDRGVS